MVHLRGSHAQVFVIFRHHWKRNMSVCCTLSFSFWSICYKLVSWLQVPTLHVVFEMRLFFHPSSFFTVGIIFMLLSLHQMIISFWPPQKCEFSREKVTIPQLKSYITIQGAGADKTIVQWGDTAQTPGAKGQPLGTFASATFAVNSPYFIAKNITFKVKSFYPSFVIG